MTARLFNLVSDHTFPTPPTTTSVTSFASSFIKSSTGMQNRNATKEVLNCLRVLQRVLPVVFEVETDASRLEMEVFWRREPIPEGSVVSEESSQPQFVIEDEEDDGEEQSTPSGTPNPSRSSTSTSQPKAAKTLPSLAERLFSCLIDLLFCCGFTLPTKLQVNHYKINYTIWYVVHPFCVVYPSHFVEGRREWVRPWIRVRVNPMSPTGQKCCARSWCFSPSRYTLHPLHSSFPPPCIPFTSFSIPQDATS